MRYSRSLLVLATLVAGACGSTAEAPTEPTTVVDGPARTAKSDDGTKSTATTGTTATSDSTGSSVGDSRGVFVGGGH